jgi:hypothetical protein
MRKTLVAGKLWLKNPATLKPDSLIHSLFFLEQSEWANPVPRNGPRGTRPVSRVSISERAVEKSLILGRERPQAARACRLAAPVPKNSPAREASRLHAGARARAAKSPCASLFMIRDWVPAHARQRALSSLTDLPLADTKKPLFILGYYAKYLL